MIDIYDRAVPDERPLSISDIAEIYGISAKSVHTMVYRGTIPAPADKCGRYHSMRWFVGQLRRAARDEYKSFLQMKKALRPE